LAYLFRKDKFENKYKTEEEFYNVFFNRLDTNSTNPILTKFQNDIFNVENRVITFCHNQVGMVDGPGSGYYESYSALAVANATRLGINEEIIITTGVAQFSRISKPSFLINEKAITANEMGIGEYKMKVSSKPGKYKIPVKISFTTEYGKPAILEKDIEYTVVE
jgi:hypothetical protein